MRSRYASACALLLLLTACPAHAQSTASFDELPPTPVEEDDDEDLRPVEPDDSTPLFEAYDDAPAQRAPGQSSPSQASGLSEQRRSLLLSDLAKLEAEKDEHGSLAGPIVTMAVGGGALFYGVSFAFIGGMEGVPEGFMTAGAIGIGVGCVMLVSGGIWLSSVSKRRNRLNREIDAIESALEIGDLSLDFAPALAPGYTGLNLFGRF